VIQDENPNDSSDPADGSDSAILAEGLEEMEAFDLLDDSENGETLESNDSPILEWQTESEIPEMPALSEVLVLPEFPESMVPESIVPDLPDELRNASEIEPELLDEPELSDELELEFSDEPLPSENTLESNVENSSVSALAATANLVQPTELIDSNEASGTSDLQWIAAASIARPKRKEVSFLRKAVPPVLGGLASIPIATAIMWYCFGRDLGSLGPFIAKYIPAIVPSNLRSGRGSSTEPLRRPSVQAPAGGTTSFPKLTKELPKLERPNQDPSPTLATSSSAMTNSSAMTTVSDLEPDSKGSQPNVAEDPSVPAEPIASLTELIASLRTQQAELYRVPKDASKETKTAMIAGYYTTAKQLAKQTSSLRGPAATVWRKELDGLAREVLSDKSCKTVMQIGPAGKSLNLPAVVEGEFFATLVNVLPTDEPNTTEPWALAEPWKLNQERYSVVMLPGSLKLDARQGTTTCLVFGRLARIDPSSDRSSEVVLQVHAAMAP
jgi:hypothetical protein